MLLATGACCLIWLAVSSLREKADAIQLLSMSDRKAMARMFFEGVVVDLFTPKVA